MELYASSTTDRVIGTQALRGRSRQRPVRSSLLSILALDGIVGLLARHQSLCADAFSDDRAPFAAGRVSSTCGQDETRQGPEEDKERAPRGSATFASVDRRPSEECMSACRLGLHGL